MLAGADPLRSHLEGRTAADLLDRASAGVAETLGTTDDAIVWTSGGTESCHLAVLGCARAEVLSGGRRRHVVVSAVEHSSILAAADRLATEHGFDVTTVGVDRAGLVDPDQVRAVLRPDTLAVHLQHANHEVGAMQPTHDVALACRAVGAVLHVDACQTVGQVGVTLDQLGADLVSASSAKFGGPAGVGVLAIGPRARVRALLEGDDRQRRRRAGQLDVASIASAGVALAVARAQMDTERSQRELVRRHLRTRLAQAVDDLELHGPLADAHPGIVAASALFVNGEALLAELDRRGIAAHSGSSCATTSGEPSHVLIAMAALTHGHVRFSFDATITVADADRAVDVYSDAVAALRATAGVRRAGR